MRRRDPFNRRPGEKPVGGEQWNLYDHWRRSSARTSFGMLESIQPIVLVGGQSLRFGRDKLREPINREGSEWLVDRPIAALRALFGPRVALVGQCDAAVSVRADVVIPDRYPGVGPAGGVLAALEQSTGDVFVLAGDLSRITSNSIGAILDAALAPTAPAVSAWVVLAKANGVQPCIGLYRQAVRPLLAERIGQGRRSLYDLVPADRLLLVSIDVAEATNVNTPDALEQ